MHISSIYSCCGIAIGLAMYFLSQEYKQAVSIERIVVINSYLHNVKPKKTADNGAAL
ncbi:MAG: hypothetical protein ACR5KV_03240 [Wolbachia sp.]